MRFASPLYLFLLAVIIVYNILKRVIRPAEFLPFPFLGAIKSSAAKPHPRDLYVEILKNISIAFLIIALARPQKGMITSDVKASGIDIMLCLDTSTSMKALDFNPRNRFDAAKAAAKEFIKSRKNDRIGVVAFSGLSFTQCPLTVDHGAVLEFVDKMQIGMTQIDGTNIGSGILTAIERLKFTKARSKVIILLTDGRNNTGVIDPVTAAKAAYASGIKIYTIGAALPGRSLYPIDDPFFGQRLVYVEDDLDEGLLSEIARITDGKYFRVKDKRGLSEIYKQIDKLEKGEIISERFTEYRELYGYFLLPGFLLFCAMVITDKVLFWRIP